MKHRFHNPILPGFYPDPSICRVGEDFYLVCSSFELCPLRGAAETPDALPLCLQAALFAKGG